jgi:hypothetical protein
MKHSYLRSGLALGLMLASPALLAAGGDLGELQKQPTNWTAIGRNPTYKRVLHSLSPHCSERLVLLAYLIEPAQPKKG